MPRRIDTEAVINAVRLDEQAGDPAQPAAGFWLLYIKAAGLFIQDDAGNVTGPFGAGGDVATDAIWDAAGDLVQGTGADAAAKLSIGTYPQILRVNSGATAAEWVSAGRVLISEQTPTGTGTVTWTSIPATYKTLEIEWVARGTNAATETNASCYFNNDTTASNYRRMIINGQANSTLAASGADDAILFSIAAGTAPANACGSGLLRIVQYAGTTFNKQVTSLEGHRIAPNNQVEWATSMEWENTAAINRISLVLAAGNYDTGSTFRLYGVF